MKSVLLTRSLTGAVFVATLVICTIYGPLYVGSLLFIICLLGLVEFYNLSRLYEIHPQKIFGVITGLFVFLYFLIRNFTTSKIFSDSFPAILLLLISSIYIIELFRKKEKPFLNISVTVFGIIYVAIPFSFLIEIGHFKYTYEYRIILGILCLIWCNDTFAYVTGSLFGKHKLMPRISPGKTWEGFIGGGIFTLIFAFFMDSLLVLVDPNHYEVRGIGKIDWIIFAAVIFVIGTIGDLIESMFKRSIGVKDSGKLMAGHGGVLDRFDSLFLAVPFIYCYLFLIKNNLPYLQTFFSNLK
ncbi:MAG: phosphatidate cytidylyltransferase [Bacteroidia bacterium]|nr:phosphatidate cytidylyltransferase [Bacteroidia bacterium]